jgi:DNA-binding transcriptional regulator YdaS (Cro superfamily)
MKTFAERLKYAMGEAGLKQSTLSENTGISKAAISQYLSGKNTPGPDRVKALADATGVAVVPVKKITTDEAARCMGKSRQFVRVGLQRGVFPFGNAVPGEGSKWSYYINPAKFRDYVGAEQFDSFFGLTA